MQWFGAYGKTQWKVGEARVAYANGRYRIKRGDVYVVSYYPPYQCPDEPWVEIGTAPTAEAAIECAQDHHNLRGQS